MHKQKMIAPALITAILLLYYIGLICVCLFCPTLPLLAKCLGITFSLLLTGVCLFVLRERIQEIRNGEEDDLSQY